MADLGHSKDAMLRLAQIGFTDGICFPLHPQLRTVTKPLSRHVSHLHAAGDENWKWNAIRSFFVLLLKG